MNNKKKKLINSLKSCLFEKVEQTYIIGSFLNKDWDSNKSDIDIIIIDKSFENYHSIYNKKYIKSLIESIPYYIDLYLYSPIKFKMRYNSDEILRNNIERGLKLF